MVAEAPLRKVRRKRREERQQQQRSTSADARVSKSDTEEAVGGGGVTLAPVTLAFPVAAGGGGRSAPGTPEKGPGFKVGGTPKASPWKSARRNWGTLKQALGQLAGDRAWYSHTRLQAGRDEASRDDALLELSEPQVAIE